MVIRTDVYKRQGPITTRQAANLAAPLLSIFCKRLMCVVIGRTGM